MKKTKKKLYVGCAINNLSPDEREAFLRRISKLKDSLRDHFEVLDFIGNVAAPAEKVYEFDIDCVESADCMLAICNHPSTGMGYEMGTAIEKRNIPVLAVAHSESSVSRMILGITHKRYRFERYEQIEDIKALAISMLGDEGIL